MKQTPATSAQFEVGDVVRTSGGKTPWRIDATGPSSHWLHAGRTTYMCTSLTSGRREEFRAGTDYLVPFTGAVPVDKPTSPLLRGHALVDEGAPHDFIGRRTSGRWGTRGTGYGLCSCGALSSLELHSAGQRKQWHRMHKDTIRAEQAA